jgi:hypothetical protein
MHWTDEVADALRDYPMPPGGTVGGGGVHVINDSKTPSGRAHVGALRGVLIHDAMFRTLRERGVRVKYRFGCDDYDPVDELPHGMKEQYEGYLGQAGGLDRATGRGSERSVCLGLRTPKHRPPKAAVGGTNQSPARTHPIPPRSARTKLYLPAARALSQSCLSQRERGGRGV